jgi:hypothetical protein
MRYGRLGNSLKFVSRAYQKMTTSDKIAALAYLTSLFSVVFPMYQWRESLRQYSEQKQSDREKDSIENMRVVRQFALLATKDSLDRVYYENEMKSNKVRDSMDRVVFKEKIRTDSIQRTFAELQFKTSVRPLVIWGTVADIRQETVGFYITNVGLGPAIMENLTIYVGERKFESWREVVLFIKSLPTIPENALFSIATLRNGFTLYPGKDVFLLKGKGEDFKESSTLAAVLSEIRVQYTFRSFAGEEFKNEKLGIEVLK